MRECTACHPNCLECTAAAINTCTQCVGTRNLRPDKVCAKNCLDGFFYDDPSDNCLSCHSSCRTCNGATSSHCLTCRSNQYQVASSCFSCSPKCLTCSGPSPFQCLSCPPTATLEASTNFCRTPASCPPGYTLDYNLDTCVQCHSTCLTCQNLTATDCLTCGAASSFPLIMANKTCQSGCPVKTFYDSPSRSCIACHATCQACSSTLDKACLLCPSAGQMVQLSGKCATGCPGGTYGMNTTHCAACHGSCSTCSGPLSTQCTACIAPTNL